MKHLVPLALSAALLLPLGAAPAAMEKRGKVPVEDIWKPAATPRGGTPWALLEATKETTRKNADGYIVSKPLFTPKVKALNGKRIKVAGYMMPLEKGAKQKHFVLLAYPPGCPFHVHAMPNQFIEINAAVPFPLDEARPHVVTGVLQLTGYDEGGIFYKLNGARPG
ncbi:MAG: DUF3299 domain-containing protein [Pseudomonadota bacterium]|nr:DUF3299 domain-containing protein [Pseudomonadota bacterium]